MNDTDWASPDRSAQQCQEIGQKEDRGFDHAEGEKNMSQLVITPTVDKSLETRLMNMRNEGIRQSRRG